MSAGKPRASGSKAKNLWNKPIVRHDFDDSSEFDGNAYTKGGWVLYMLRHELGDDAFYRAMKHYLEAIVEKNVVTADLARAIEESSTPMLTSSSANGCTAQALPSLTWAMPTTTKNTRLRSPSSNANGRRPSGNVPRAPRSRNYNRRWLETPSDHGFESHSGLHVACGFRAASSCSSIRGATCSSQPNFTKKRKSGSIN